MSQELKPCPFCGGEAEMMGDLYPYVECTDCGVNLEHDHSYDSDFDDAAAKWNTRHIPEGFVTKEAMDARVIQAVHAARKGWARQATYPEGYTLVPVEPTAEMLFAGRTDISGSVEQIECAYKAMIKAGTEATQ